MKYIRSVIKNTCPSKIWSLQFFLYFEKIFLYHGPKDRVKGIWQCWMLVYAQVILQLKKARWRIFAINLTYSMVRSGKIYRSLAYLNKDTLSGHAVTYKPRNYVWTQCDFQFDGGGYKCIMHNCFAKATSWCLHLALKWGHPWNHSIVNGSTEHTNR